MHVLFTICSFMEKYNLVQKLCYCCYIYGLFINCQILLFQVKKHSIFIYRNVWFIKRCIWIRREKFVRCSFAKSPVNIFCPQKIQNQRIYINTATHSVVVSHLSNFHSSKSVCRVWRTKLTVSN